MKFESPSTDIKNNLLTFDLGWGKRKIETLVKKDLSLIQVSLESKINAYNFISEEGIPLRSNQILFSLRENNECTIYIARKKTVLVTVINRKGIPRGKRLRKVIELATDLSKKFFEQQYFIHFIGLTQILK